MPALNSYTNTLVLGKDTTVEKLLFYTASCLHKLREFKLLRYAEVLCQGKLLHSFQTYKAPINRHLVETINQQRKLFFPSFDYSPSAHAPP